MLATGPPIVIGESGSVTMHSDDFANFFQADVVNIGQCPVIVESVGWLVPLGLNMHLMVQQNRSAVDYVKNQSTELPCTMRHGESAKWIFDPWTLPEPDHELDGTKYRALAWLRVRFIKFELRTSVGKKIRVRADAGIRQYVWEMYLSRYYPAPEKRG